MKIGIDARSTIKRITGIGYYTINLINAIGNIDSDNIYYLYYRMKYFDRRKTPPRIPGDNFHPCINRFGLSDRYVLPRMDVYHTSDYSTRRPRCKRYVITVHDVINKTYPAGRSEDDLARQDRNLKNALSEADVIITDVRSTKKDLLEYYDIGSDKIHPVYPGRNECFFKTDRNPVKIKHFTARLGIEFPYMLYVGTIEPRKNIKNILKAYSLLDKKLQNTYNLVLTGSQDVYYDAMREYVQKLGISKRVTFTGYIAREDMNELVNYCEMFLYPSFYEGFGFPILEAMSCGRPVITSNVSSCAELAGDAAVTVDPESTKDLAKAIEKLASDKLLSSEYASRALKRSKDFSWKKTATEMIRIFQNGS